MYNALNNRNFKIRVGQATNSSQTNVDRNNSVNSSGRLSMKVDNSEVESIRLSLLADNIYLNNNGTLCYLFIQTRGNINYTGSVSLSGDSAMVSIPRQNLNQGINHITIFNFEGKPVLEKYIFNPVYDKNDISVRVSGKTGVRDYISVEFELPGKQGQQSDTGGLSISVAPADGSDNQDIADYMIFGSEFGVLPEKISSRSKNDIPSGEMNEFLSSVRSNWIDWNVILSDKVPAYRFQIEKEDHFLTGRLLNIETGNPAPGEYIFLSRPGKKASFRYARSDKDGFFTFNLPISEELQDIVIQPEKADKNYKIRLESAFPEELIQAGKSKVVDIERASQKISELSANYQVRKIYGISSTGKASVPEKPLPSFSRFYGKPDAAINMDDYIKLPVMQEVFFELLPGVSLKSRKASYEFSINDLIVNNLDIKPPGMLIDGVVVNNAASIAGLDPELVERIEVVEEPYLVGRYIFYGLISIITRKGDFSCISLPDYAIRLSYRVNDTVPSFISPDYSAVTEKQSTIPDFRNTLYWNPSVEPGKGGKAEVGFWTSDYVADYVINIQGIDENGHLVSSRKILRIDQPRRN